MHFCLFVFVFVSHSVQTICTPSICFVYVGIRMSCGVHSCLFTCLPACITLATIVPVTQQMSLIQFIEDNNLEVSDQGSHLIPHPIYSIPRDCTWPPNTLTFILTSSSPPPRPTVIPTLTHSLSSSSLPWRVTLMKKTRFLMKKPYSHIPPHRFTTLYNTNPQSNPHCQLTLRPGWHNVHTRVCCEYLSPSCALSPPCMQ